MNDFLLVDKKTGYMDELYGEWYKCPNCDNVYIDYHNNFCQKCGERVIVLPESDCFKCQHAFELNKLECEKCSIYAGSSYESKFKHINEVKMKFDSISKLQKDKNELENRILIELNNFQNKYKLSRLDISIEHLDTTWGAKERIIEIINLKIQAEL